MSRAQGRPNVENVQTKQSSNDAYSAKRGKAVSAAAGQRTVLRVLLIVVAVILYAIQAPVLAAVYGAGVVGMLLALPASAGVVLAARNPQAATGVVLLGTAAIALVSASGDGLPFPWTVPSMLALFVCCLMVGFDVPVREAAITWSVTMVISLALQLAAGGLAGSYFVTLWLSLGMLALGAGIRQLRASEARAKEHEVLGAHERERREVLQEKARMARELHDVVAHHMSVISVQAASAEFRIQGLPEQARQEFAEISEQSRSSLAELRRILGVLRAEDDGAHLAPQPGVHDIGRIIEHVARAGTHVQLTSDDLSGLPESVSIATYRIVQEGLSNAVRHAPGASAQVIIERSQSAIEILVQNAAATTPAHPIEGAGHGIRGMRERAFALGGTLSTAATADGGFQVRAWLPIQSWEHSSGESPRTSDGSQ